MRIIISRAPRGESLRFLCWGGIGDTKILRKRKGEGEVLLLLSSSEIRRKIEAFLKKITREKEREKEILARRGRTGAFSEHVVVFILLAAS